MTIKQYNNLPDKDKEKIIQNELDYLLTEGVVVKVGDKYRLKTKQEIQQEIENIYNS
jgi:hypothetical protein